MAAPSLAIPCPPDGGVCSLFCHLFSIQKALNRVVVWGGICVCS